MEALVIALLVPAVGGLAYIAYNHPGPFKRIANVLLYTSIAAYFAIAVWCNSELSARIDFQSAIYSANDIPSTAKAAAVAAITRAAQARALPMVNLSIGFFVWYIYLTILRYLPNILELGDKSKPNA
jgi:hypothetical protein